MVFKGWRLRNNLVRCCMQISMDGHCHLGVTDTHIITGTWIERMWYWPPVRTCQTGPHMSLASTSTKPLYTHGLCILLLSLCLCWCLLLFYILSYNSMDITSQYIYLCILHVYFASFRQWLHNSIALFYQGPETSSYYIVDTLLKRLLKRVGFTFN